MEIKALGKEKAQAVLKEYKELEANNDHAESYLLIAKTFELEGATFLCTANKAHIMIQGEASQELSSLAYSCIKDYYYHLVEQAGNKIVSEKTDTEEDYAIKAARVLIAGFCPGNRKNESFIQEVARIIRREKKDSE